MAEARINVEATTPDPSPVEAVDFVDHRINVDLYSRMMDLDIIGHKAPFYLWHGKLVEKEESPGRDDFEPYRIGLDRYRQMVEAGVFGAESVALWQGRLVKPMLDPMQNFVASLLRERLIEIIPPGWVAVASRPVAINECSLPEPDLAILRGSLRDFLDRWPVGLDVGGLIEVADATLAIDRGIKLRAYAAARLPWYAVVNIPDRRVEVYERPIHRADEPGYAVRCDYHPGEGVPVVLDGERIGLIAVGDIFP